jgi:hypothetical protein
MNITNYFTSLNNNNLNLEPMDLKTTHSFRHDQLFNKYQNKIKNKKENSSNKGYGKIKKTAYIEGFNLLETNVTGQAQNVYSSTSVSSDQISANQQLLTNYENALTQYQSEINKVTQLIENYFAQISPNNPYLGKNIRFSDSGAIYYVTQQGVAKYYSEEIWNSLIATPNSFPNCPNSSNLINIDIPWISAYLTFGSTIPTTPQLTVGTPMISGQSCGNEGKNVIVNSLIEDTQINFIGNYNDNPTNPLMTPIGSEGSSFEGCEQQAAMDGYTYFALQNVNNNYTGQCMGSNDISQATSQGQAIQASPTILWSSNTASLGGTSASLTSSGTLVVYDANSNIVYQSPSPNISTPPANSQAAVAAQTPPPPTTSSNTVYGINPLFDGFNPNASTPPTTSSNTGYYSYNPYFMG